MCQSQLYELHSRMWSASTPLFHGTQGLATSDHTTLLLNCYTKLKDVAKLDEFLRRSGEGDRPTLNFDVDTAVKVHHKKNGAL